MVDTGDFIVVSFHILHSLNFAQEHFTPRMSVLILFLILWAVFYSHPGKGLWSGKS